MLCEMLPGTAAAAAAQVLAYLWLRPDGIAYRLWSSQISDGFVDRGPMCRMSSIWH